MDSQVPRQAFESIQKKVSDLRGRAAASTLPMDALEFARKKIVDIQERAIASHLAEPALPTLEFSEPTLGDSLATEQQVNHFDPPITPENDAETQSDFADMTVDAATGGAGGSLSKSDLAVVSKSTSSLEIWGNSRLLPLLFCVIGLGWILPRILPVRFFTGDGVQIFLGILAIPLFLWSFLILVRPSKKILTKQFLSTGVVACLFTWVIGITLLVALQKIGQNQLDDFKFIPGKAALFSVASWVIGWLYQGAFHPEAAGMLQRILGWIFGVGLCEEFIKIIPVLLFFRLMRKESTASDQEAFPLLKEMVMIGIFSGIGFGIGEALRCYAPSSGNYGYGSLVTRWFALISSHAIWTGIVAQILWMIRDDLKGGSAKKIILIGLGASMSSGLMHGIYDLICGQWLLAVIANAVGILLFYHLINRCEEPSAFAISTMPQPILDLESWLWRKPTRKFGIAAAFVFIIYGIGSFGLSYDEARIQVELSPAQQSGGDYQSNEADRRLFKEFEDVYSVTEILGKRNGLNALEIVMASINGMNWNGASPDLLRSLNEMRSIRSGESPDSRGKKMEKFIYINSKY